MNSEKGIAAAKKVSEFLGQMSEFAGRKQVGRYEMTKKSTQKRSSSEYWTTSHEKDFISQLGKIGALPLPRATLLKKYRDSMERRVDWDQIDKDEIAAFVGDAIEKEARKGGDAMT